MSEFAPPPGYTATPLIDPFEQLIGPVFEKGTYPDKSYAFRIDARHVNRRGVLHGGMAMTLADLTHGQAVWDETGKLPCVTLNMQTHFLKPAAEGDLVEVTPRLVQRTRALVFMRGDFLVRGAAIFTAASIWKLLGAG